jgi:hypothetical protein
MLSNASINPINPLIVSQSKRLFPSIPFNIGRSVFHKVSDQVAPLIAGLRKLIMSRDWIDGLYAVEKEAKAEGIEGSSEHFALRNSRSKPIIDELKDWLNNKSSLYAPSEGLGKAITYLRNQWEGLTRFLEDSRIPLDNKLSERMLRRIGIVVRDHPKLRTNEAACRGDTNASRCKR